MASHAPSAAVSQLRIQACLTAAAVNLKRLAAAILLMLLAAMAGVSAARIASVPWRRPRHPGQPSIPAAARLAIPRWAFFDKPEDMVDAVLAGLDQGEFATAPSLPDTADWDALKAARLALRPGLPRAAPASRYDVLPREHSSGRRDAA